MSRFRDAMDGMLPSKFEEYLNESSAVTENEGIEPYLGAEEDSDNNMDMFATLADMGGAGSNVDNDGQVGDTPIEKCGAEKCTEGGEEEEEIEVDVTPTPADGNIAATNDAPLPEDSLTDDEAQRVDNDLNTIGTAILLQEELPTEDALKEFVESVDARVAEAEGLITEKAFYNKTIVRLDKNARMKQLFDVAVRSIAREKNDPLFRKYTTLGKMRRVIRNKLRAKYAAPARARVKLYMIRLRKSNSSTMKNIAKKVSK